MQSFGGLRVVLGVALALAALGVFWFAAQTAAGAAPKIADTIRTSGVVRAPEV